MMFCGRLQLHLMPFLTRSMTSTHFKIRIGRNWSSIPKTTSGPYVMLTCNIFFCKFCLLCFIGNVAVCSLTEPEFGVTRVILIS